MYSRVVGSFVEVWICHLLVARVLVLYGRFNFVNDVWDIPIKGVWKNILNERRNSISRKRFTQRENLTLWLLWRPYPKIKCVCSSLLKTVGKYLSNSYKQTCTKCGDIIYNISVHLLSFCHGNETNYKRQQLWSDIIESQGIQSYRHMMNLEIKEQCSYILKFATKNGDFG